MPTFCLGCSSPSVDGLIKAEGKGVIRMNKTVATALYILAIFLGVQVGVKLGSGFFAPTVTPAAG